jgi:hypothetical protein
MTENEGKMNRGQDFPMNFQDQGVNMDHPMTQRMKNQPKAGKPKEKRKQRPKEDVPQYGRQFCYRTNR